MKELYFETHPERKEMPLGYSLSLGWFQKQNPKGKQRFLQEFVYQSNLIENITQSFDVLTENQRPKLDDHYRALEFMLDNYEKDLTQESIKSLQSILMENLLSEFGEYRAVDAVIDTDTISLGAPKYYEVPKLMTNLEEEISYLENPSMQDLMNIHCEFETVHPFVDGNGRTGRLLLNWLTLKHLQEFVVIHGSKQQEYFKTVQSYRAEFKEKHSAIKFGIDLPKRD